MYMSLIIEVLWMAGEDTFVTSVNGDCTIEHLVDIEKEIRDNEQDLSFPECSTVKFKCYYESRWDDYGSGYGDILHHPGYWDITMLSYTTLDNMEASQQLTTNDKSEPQADITPFADTCTIHGASLCNGVCNGCSYKHTAE